MQEIICLQLVCNLIIGLLGEGSRVVMVVHTSPSEDDLLETICTLTFAKRVRSIESNRELSEVVDSLMLKLSTSLPENSFVFKIFHILSANVVNNIT